MAATRHAVERTDGRTGAECRARVEGPFRQAGSGPLGRSAARILALALLTVWAAAPAAAQDAAGDAAARGERVYRQLCASCHGAAGEGVKDEFARPLVGDRSVSALARYIEARMPKDEPELCVGDDAQAVARYIHDAFYSPIAQARNRPPRVDPARLTVRQYRNAVADLVGSFRRPTRVAAERGLRGTYFNGRQPGGSPALERIDAEIRFEFGPSRPAPEGVDRSGFAARWEGSVLAPDTGEHEFIIRTDRAFRLWVNDPDEPLIDAWVKSGSNSEYRASRFLLDGRAYPIRLEFTTGDQGVEKDADKEQIEAFVSLCWKPPKRAEEVIPHRHLAPDRATRTFVVAAPFPPDDRSVGYERGSSISKAWAEAATAAAMETAGHVAAHLDELAELRDAGADRAARVTQFCSRFVERAFRRPLSEEQKKLYVDRPLEGAPDPVVGVKRVVLLALSSPRFLWSEGGGTAPDAWTVASRLSFALWDSLPDQDLLECARAGRLLDREEVVRQAERMVRDARFPSKLRQFFHQWLQVEHIAEIAKDRERFPGFDEKLASDLRISLDLFLEGVVGSERGDFRDLLLSSDLHLNGRLGRFYGHELPPDAPFEKVASEPARRFGVLSHPYLLARFAYPDGTSPIHRGVFIVRSLLGRTLQPPPAAFAPLAPDLHPDLTTRERVALQTQPEPCQACHRLINPLGFTLERFDAVGRWREDDSGKPVDASGAYETPGGETLTFAGGRELAEYLATSEQAHGAFVAQLFHHLVKQPILAYGPSAREELRKAFSDRGFNVRALAVAITTQASLWGTEQPPAGGAAPPGPGAPEPPPSAREATVQGPAAPDATREDCEDAPDPRHHGDTST